MLIRKFFLATAFLMVFSGAAQADRYDDDDSSDDDKNRGYSQYVSCLKTRPIRFHGTIVDAALATPELSTLAFAVQAAGLVDVLNSKGPFTVFAPTDAAFGAVPADILSAIVADVDLLSAVLTYHVLPGKGRRLDPRRTIRGWALEKDTVLGQSVFFNRSKDGPQVNQSNVSCQAVKTDNGVVWFVDSVLLPQF